MNFRQLPVSLTKSRAQQHEKELIDDIPTQVSLSIRHRYLCWFFLLNRSFLSVPNGGSVSDISDSSVEENNGSHFTDSGSQLPEAKTSDSMKGNSSFLGRWVAAQKNESPTSTGNKTTSTSSSPQVPITFPDGNLVPQPPERTLEDEVRLTKLLLEELDKDPSVIGICENSDTGRVYPLYPNTVYVKRTEGVNEQGIRFIEEESRFGTEGVSLDGPIPAGVRVIELDMNGDPIRDYIASGDFWEFILSHGFDPVTYGDLVTEIVAKIEREYHPKETFNSVKGHTEDANWTSGLENYLEQANNFPPSKTETVPIDKEIRLRSLFHQYEFEKELQRTEQAESEIMGWGNRLPYPPAADAALQENDERKSIRDPQILR